jgi:4-hydroxy-tetrahydrodipicolinate synthase
MASDGASEAANEPLNFSGIWIPLVTPFRDGRVDKPALSRLVEHLAAQGVAGFVACGSTGEAAMLDEDEQALVLATTLHAAQGLPVLMGVSGARPERVADRACQLAIDHAVAGFLLTAPAYVKPSQAGIAAYFEAVASASPRPIVAYDIPARTGVRIEARTLLDLAAHPNIVALKDCSGDRAAAEAVLADGRLALLCGNDDELFDQLARGAAGGITASAHAQTSAFVELHQLLRSQQLQQAQALWRHLLPITRALFAEPNPAPLKALLSRQGWLADELRAPLHRASAATAEAALAALAAITRP